MKILIMVCLAAISSGIWAQPMIIAHRGASWLAPENTVVSANLAWELDADAVEVDVHLSRDNRIMVIHDFDTKRTCSGKKNLKIEKTPSILLRDLDAGSWKDSKFKGEKIPYLSEIIETIPPGKVLVVEIKCGSEILPHLERMLEKTDKASQIVFISFGWQTILDTKKMFTDNDCFWLSENKNQTKKRLKDAAEAGLEGVNLQHAIVDEEMMIQARSYGLEVLTWTVDDPEEAYRLQKLGVKGITTNRPGWLKEKLIQADAH